MNNVSYRVVNQGEMYPYVIFDNWFIEEEEKKIWFELDFYITNFPAQIDGDSGGGDTGTSFDGTKKATGLRWYPIMIFDNNNLDIFPISSVLSTRNKTMDENFRDIMINGCNPYGNQWKDNKFLPNTDTAGTIITYYSENDEYLPHHDMSSWTQLVWMVKDEEAMETGSGDLEFPEFNHTIPLKNNRCVFFPSCYLHVSKPIKFKKQNPVIGDGKYTITNFYI
tara:strand:+ start:2119 stop:2787 length:669 start_codon:yes stop_codon:yes gene_type:complete